MALEQMQANDLNLAEPSVTRSGRQFFRKHPEVWVAVVLWLASNAFVAGFSNLARWETGAPYYSMTDLCRWDCGWYGSVARSGYDRTPQRDTGNANWPFHPLFPITVYPFHHWLNLPLGMSLVLASKSALLLAIYGFLLMTGEPTDATVDRFRAGSLVALNPYLIYAHAGYAEPLYFALLALAFYFVAKRRWIESGVMGALLSATRVVGFLFAVSYAVVWLRDVGWRSTLRRDNLNKLIGFLLCPLGTAIFMLYMYQHTGDALAQIHNQVSWGKSPGNPFDVLWQCLIGHHWLRVWGAMTIAAFLASAYLFKLRKPEFAIYLAIAILVPLSAGYWGLARYVWWQPPFLYAICCALKRHSAWWVIYVAFASGMASFMILEWFTGHNFVV
jgi:hypothetical protein